MMWRSPGFTVSGGEIQGTEIIELADHILDLGFYIINFRKLDCQFIGNIIDGISNDDAGLNDYANTYKSSILFPFPNRIEDGAYEFRGTTHQLHVNEVSVNNTIHGLVYNKEFQITSMASDDNRTTIELTYTSDGLSPGFPFIFELKLIYTISANGSLNLRFEVANQGNLPFPYGMGWHPYFCTDNLNDASFSFSSKDFYACNNRSIPFNTKDSELPEEFTLEDKTFDDAFSLDNARCDFNTDRYNLSLDFKYPEGTYLQVYTPPLRKSIAIEPMTCVANSFNNQIGFSELNPGDSDTWRIDLFYITKS